jgi:hypothetical protein
MVSGGLILADADLTKWLADKHRRTGWLEGVREYRPEPGAAAERRPADGGVPAGQPGSGSWLSTLHRGYVVPGKGGQNTRYPIFEPELPEPRPEVPEPEIPDHNFG